MLQLETLTSRKEHAVIQSVDTYPCLDDIAHVNHCLLQAAAKALSQLPDGASADLALLHVSSVYGNTDRLEMVVPELKKVVPGLSTVVGCSSAGAIGMRGAGRAVEVGVLQPLRNLFYHNISIYTFRAVNHVGRLRSVVEKSRRWRTKRA